MSTIHLELSDSARRFAEEQARGLGFGSIGEYVESLLTREQDKHLAIARLEAELREGQNSGTAVEANDHFWERKRSDLLARHRAREQQQDTAGKP